MRFVRIVAAFNDSPRADRRKPRLEPTSRKRRGHRHMDDTGSAHRRVNRRRYQASPSVGVAGRRVLVRKPVGTAMPANAPVARVAGWVREVPRALDARSQRGWSSAAGGVGDAPDRLDGQLVGTRRRPGAQRQGHGLGAPAVVDGFAENPGRFLVGMEPS